MGILMSLIIGLIVGIIAKFLMPGRDPGGLIITMFLGIAGALIAHSIGSAFGFYEANEPAGFVASVIGAMLLLGLYRLFVGRRQLTH